MTAVPLLLTSDRQMVLIDEGDSLDVVATFKDGSGSAIAKASISALTATLYNKDTEAAINSRNAQSVLDANDGTVASDGTLTLRLNASDSPIVGDLETDEVEEHILDLAWTWSDGVATRTNSDKRIIRVRKKADVS